MFISHSFSSSRHRAIFLVISILFVKEVWGGNLSVIIVTIFGDTTASGVFLSGSQGARARCLYLSVGGILLVVRK